MRTLSGMTLSQSKQLYVDAGGPSDHSQSEWNEIHEEMKAIVAAKSDRAAAKVIDWWQCWDRKYTATAFARRVRASHANADMRALIPCRYCGATRERLDKRKGEGVHVYHNAPSSDIPPWEHVVCLECGSSAPSVEAWNRRQIESP